MPTGGSGALHDRGRHDPTPSQHGHHYRRRPVRSSYDEQWPKAPRQPHRPTGCTRDFSNPAPNVRTSYFTIQAATGWDTATNVSAAIFCPRLTLISTAARTYNSVTGVWTVGAVTTAIAPGGRFGPASQSAGSDEYGGYLQCRPVRSQRCQRHVQCDRDAPAVRPRRHQGRE